MFFLWFFFFRSTLYTIPIIGMNSIMSSHIRWTTYITYSLVVSNNRYIYCFMQKDVLNVLMHPFQAHACLFVFLGLLLLIFDDFFTTAEEEACLASALLVVLLFSSFLLLVLLAARISIFVTNNFDISILSFFSLFALVV